MKTASLEHRYQHLGTVYRLIEQFELISRTDLAKLSGIAPASITMLTKSLIDNGLIIERASQTLSSRGRPAVGLALSPFYWQFLCITLSAEKATLCLSDLSGMALSQQDYALNLDTLSSDILKALDDFCLQVRLEPQNLFAVSVSVIGKVSTDKLAVIQLGQTTLHCPLKALLSQKFCQPILLNEHFSLWFLAESTLGHLIRHDDVIYLHLDEEINLSVKLKGTHLHHDEHKRMNVDKMLMPKLSPLSDEIGEHLDEWTRYQLKNQITFSALTRLIDRYLPNNCTSTPEKIALLCHCVEQKQSKALWILEHITQNLAYMLMNLINLFSIQTVMFNSPLLQIKHPLFERLHTHLHQKRLLNDTNVQIITSQYHWNSSHIPSIAIKLGIYDGRLLNQRLHLTSF